jgi:hypothetical protein
VVANDEFSFALPFSGSVIALQTTAANEKRQQLFEEFAAHAHNTLMLAGRLIW